MCVVSMVGDHYSDKWQNINPHRWPTVVSDPDAYRVPYPNASPNSAQVLVFATKAEFDALKKDVEEMKALLIRAKKYDEDNGEPNCEVADKMKLLRAVAKLVGVELPADLG